ncbi:MAG: lysophospholipid acyltransferase family protein [Planctomycetaceae bacterium]
MASVSAAVSQVEGPDSPRRNGLWLVSQAIFRIFCTVWLRLRVDGLQHVPARGGGLLLANHQSFLDPPLIAVRLSRPVSFVARSSLFRVPVVGWFLRRTGVISINRESGGTAVVRDALKRMHTGWLVGVFPEGTRSVDGQLGEFKPGFAALARRSDLPIYPVGVAGANRAFGRGARFVKPGRVCVVFGPPLMPSETVELCQRGREAELLTLIRARIADCQRQAEAQLSPAGPGARG